MMTQNASHLELGISPLTGLPVTNTRVLFQVRFKFPNVHVASVLLARMAAGGPGPQIYWLSLFAFTVTPCIK